MIRFKLDENLHPDVAAFFQGHGFDALTVWDQGLRGCSDREVIEECRSEGRALVTLDLGFADIRFYPPEHYPGLIVLRLEKQSRDYVLRVASLIVGFLQREPLAGRLWIVDESSIRVRGE